MPTEQHVHAVIAKYLNHALPIGAFHAAIDSAQPSHSTGRKLKARGGIKGFPDHIVMTVGCPVIFFEVKTEIGRLSPEQEFVANQIRANGGIWFMVRSAEEVEEALRLIGVPLRASFTPLLSPPKPKRKARAAKPEPRYTAGKRVIARAAKQGIRL